MDLRIIQNGRDGTIEYREGGHVCRCYWEFGGGEVIAIINLPPATGWDDAYPWAKGRRRAVLEALVAETVRRRAPRARVEWDDASGCVYLK